MSVAGPPPSESNFGIKDFVIEESKALVPVAINNPHKVRAMISSNARKIVAGNGIGQVNVSVYVTMLIRFKVGCILEDVNQDTYLLLRRFSIDQQYDKVKFNETTFCMAIAYNYSESVYADEASLNYDVDDVGVVLPTIKGLTLFFIPEGTDTKTQLIDGHALADEMEKTLLKYQIVSKEKFVYIQCETHEDQQKIKKALDKRCEGLRQLVKNLSAIDTELKFKLDMLIAKTLGEVL